MNRPRSRHVEFGVRITKQVGGRGSGPGPSPAPRVAIIGAGAGGLAMGISLKKAGIHSFTIFEKTGGVGGTWYDNTYPGAQCDIMSHLYSFSFELKRDWSRLYAMQAEILAYLEHCTDKYGLRPHLRCDTPIAEARWDDGASLWRLRTENGEVVEAEVVVSALGMLNVPAYPDTAGLDRFAGPLFHSSRWDHSVDLTGKRVGVIGTGASALQFVPEIAPDVSHLTIFQRTPQWVMPGRDRPYTDAELRLFRRIPLAARLHRSRIFWRQERMTTFHPTDKKTHVRMLSAKANLEDNVADPEVRELLRPDHPIGCKRQIRSSTWYPTLCRDDVRVVPEKIGHLTELGIVTVDGEEHPLDVVILATGFQASNYLCAVEIHGRDGRSLREDWSSGAEAYRGVAVSGYPNLFMLYGPNSNQPGNSVIFALESQVRFVMSAIRRMRRRGIASLDVRRLEMDRFNRTLQDRLGGTNWAGGCTSYYMDPSGKITTQWPYRAIRYWALTRRIRGGHFQATPADLDRSSPGHGRSQCGR